MLKKHGEFLSICFCQVRKVGGHEQGRIIWIWQEGERPFTPEAGIGVR